MARKGENIYKRKDGRWEGRYIRGYDVSGKAKQGYVYGRTYSEVKEKLTYLKANAKNDKIVVSSGMTLSKWLEKWIAQKGQIKASTLMIYKSRIKNHINPAIGRLKLKTLNKDILQQFIDDLAQKYKPSTVKGVYALLKSALESAEEKNLVSGFYQSIKLPKSRSSQVKALSKDEQKALENVIRQRNDPNDIGVLISLYTGIRIGELCALQWQNVNLDKGVIYIRETLQRIENENSDSKTKINFAEPKSLSSHREIPLPKFLIELLIPLQHNEGFVINRNGKFIEPRTYTRRFKKLLKLAGLPDMGYHCTRHTFATRALEIGVDPKTLSEILGHSSVGITLNLYAHSLEEHKKKEIERLGNLFDKQSD
ncbi:MAG: site-specific integrase [Oscillospiraceae bacterium]|nr:site-specific integrase [Oscillospiraceae bacterium]